EGRDGQDLFPAYPCPSCPSRLSPLLSQHRLHPCEVAADRANLLGRLEMAHRFLNRHAEQLIGEVAHFRAQFVRAHRAQLSRLHSIFSCAKRVANFVWIGSFEAASVKASRASFSLTPSISNSTRPGRTTATHCSGAPLPLPIRVSCGFLVIGLSGNTRTPILPPRAIERVIATRAASIWRAVTHHGSIAFNP